MIDLQHKFCSKCKLTKEISLFQRDASRPDNKTHWCTACRKSNRWFDKLPIEERRLKMGQWQSTYLKKNLNARLKHNLRARLRSAIVTHTKVGSAVRELGCTIDELKTHLSEKFINGMTWENYGEWHIDHIIPLSRINLSDIDAFKMACHYTNLQPLWARDNINKSDNIGVDH